MSARIALAQPGLGDLEARYVQEAVASSWISSTGPFVDRFESSFARACGTAHALSVCNGTAALHLALLALGAGPGDEVIVPSLSYVASANAITYTGATAVFVDVDPATWCLDPEQVAIAVGPRTVGIVAVHLYGHPADMDPLLDIAGLHGLWLVEDAAQAPFGRYRGRTVGSLATVATFSFYGNKVITSGEGGAATTDDEALAERMRRLRGQGMDPDRRYWFPVVGYNYRLTNVACAILCAQLERADELLGRRRDVAAWYADELGGTPWLEPQPVAPWAEWVPWLQSVLVAREGAGIDRDGLMRTLEADGIETRPFFVPIHALPPYEPHATAASGVGRSLEVTADLASRGLNLPLHPGLSRGDVARVAGAVRAAVHGST